MPDCSKALIPATKDVSFDETRNLSLAYRMSESTYNDAKHNFGAEAVIYGIPMGANYDDYHQAAEAKASAYGLNDFQRYAYAYSSSALTNTNVAAYRACLVSQGGLALVAHDIGHSNYVISLEYMPFPSQPPTPLKGEIGHCTNIDNASLHSMISSIQKQNFGHVTLEFVITPIDPTQEVAVSASVGGSGDAIILPPLQTREIQPAQEVLAGQVLQILKTRQFKISIS